MMMYSARREAGLVGEVSRMAPMMQGLIETEHGVTDRKYAVDIMGDEEHGDVVDLLEVTQEFIEWTA